MPYTSSSIALVWIVTFALFGLTASGAVSGPWMILVVLSALATPALLRRSPVAPVTLARDGKGTPVVAVSREVKTLTADLLRWENDGGARRADSFGPAPAGNTL